MSQIRHVGIIGAGMMGAEIGLCFAVSGCKVTLKDLDVERAGIGKEKLAKVLEKAIKKGRFSSESRDEALDLISPTADYDDLVDADLVVETVFEKFEVKQQVLADVDNTCKPDCIIVTNTSSIPITKLSTTVGESRRPLFAGTHFFAPAFIMKLVEIIPGLETAEDTIEAIMDACRMINKTPIRVKDTAGFVVNRLLFALFGEAVRLVDEGIASCQDIDTACQLGLGHPLGPLALMDMADLGMALDIGNLLKEAHGDRFRFGEALKQKIYAGHLGRKSGKGWYSYD